MLISKNRSQSKFQNRKIFSLSNHKNFVECKLVNEITKNDFVEKYLYNAIKNSTKPFPLFIHFNHWIKKMCK